MQNENLDSMADIKAKTLVITLAVSFAVAGTMFGRFFSSGHLEAE